MKSLVFSLAICSVLQAFAAAKVDRVLVRQNWPWSKDVTVEYEVSGATAPAAVSFAYFDGETPLAASETAVVSGDNLWAGNGPHLISFDPVEMFGSRAFADFRVEVSLGEENAKMADHLYRVVDLDTGAITDLSRADFYNNKGYGTFETDYAAIHTGFVTALEDVFIWTGVTNNPEYKTSKLVLRYIPAKDVVWSMGNANATAGMTAHNVKLTENYYIGVFQLTQEQLYRITGSYGESFTADSESYDHLKLPACGVSFNLLRGTGSDADWPNSRTIGTDSFFDKLAKKTGERMVFDFPTEAQWEYACNAGKNTTYPSGSGSYISSMAYSAEGNPNPMEVGSLCANAFGLYDVIGNVWEWCLDWYVADYTPSADPDVDPKGVLKSEAALENGAAAHTLRGAAYNSKSSKLRYSGARMNYSSTRHQNHVGCRVWAAADVPGTPVAPTAVSATVEAVAVRQDLPFSKDVIVDYVVSGASAPVAVSFEFYDGERKLTAREGATLKGDTAFAKNGANRISFDPTDVFATDAEAIGAFRVRVLLGEENAKMAEHLYRIVDLDTGDVTDLARMDFYNNKGYGAFVTSYQDIDADFSTGLEDVFIWTGVKDNPIYKTSKLVLRYIPAKDVVWTLGSDDFTNAKPPHQVKLTEDYYMGVFEITQEQYHRLTGSYGGSQASGFQVDNDETYGSHLILPAGAVLWQALMGNVTTWPASRTPTESSFLGKLRTRVDGRIAFSLPTDAEWEFAARAGTTTRFYGGPNGGYNTLGRTGGNTYPLAVGSYKPNAFGLYDTFGNVTEWCVNWYRSGYATVEGVEENPTGVAQSEADLDNGTAEHPYRGAGYSSTYSQSGTAYRGGYNNTRAYAVLGGRVWAPADK